MLSDFMFVTLNLYEFYINVDNILIIDILLRYNQIFYLLCEMQNKSIGLYFSLVIKITAIILS